MKYNVLKIEELVDLAADHNLAPTNYFTLWNDIAQWQLGLLHNEGMQESSYVLDVGCGALRMGISLINFLKDNHYSGIDAYQGYTDLGRSLAKKYCKDKNFDLICNDNLDLEQFNKKFDFAISQSVFTHLSNENIKKCFDSLVKVMKPGGKLIFTYLINTTATRGFLYDGMQAMERPAIDSDDFFREIAHERSLKFHILDANHPTRQSVAVCQF